MRETYFIEGRNMNNDLIPQRQRNINIVGLKNLLNSLDVSANTLKEYKTRLDLFFSFLANNEFNADTYLNYKRYLATRTDYTIATKNKYLISARVFCKEANRTGHIKVDITQNVKSFKETKKHKREGLNEIEINLLLEHLGKQRESETVLRAKAIFSLLIFQGLRQIEIVRLDVKDFEPANMRLAVWGKGKDGKELIDLQPQTVNALKQYCEVCKIRDGVLFPCCSNRAKGKRLTTRGLRLFVSNVLKELNIDKTVHGFRHYFITTLIKEMDNLHKVLKYTRHRNVEMLQIYDDDMVSREDLPKFYNAFSSLAFH